MGDDSASRASAPERPLVSEGVYQQASRQLNIALASYCQACDARNLLYPEGMLTKNARGQANCADLDLYQLVKVKGVQCMLDAIKHANLDTEMHRCSASLLLIVVQSLVYCSQQLTFTRAEFELEAMQSRSLDDPGEWPKNALKQMLMMDGINALLALVYKNNVADIQATAISCITCLVQLSKYAADQLICPVQMFVIANRDDASQRQMRRRTKEKRTAPLGSNSSSIPTGLSVMLAAMKLHRNKYEVAAAVARAVQALLDQNLDGGLKHLESTQASSVSRVFQNLQVKLFSTSAPRQAANIKRWEVIDLCIGFLKRWNRFVCQTANSSTAPPLPAPVVAHDLVLRLLLRLIAESRSAAMCTGSQKDNVTVLNAALAVHADDSGLQQLAEESISIMESYQQEFAVPAGFHRAPSSPILPPRSPLMPDILYPSPIRSRPTTPATSQASTLGQSGRAANITRLMKTDFTQLQHMDDATSLTRPRPVSAKPPTRQEAHFQLVRDVYKNGGPRSRRGPRKVDKSISKQLASTTPAVLMSPEPKGGVDANKPSGAQPRMLRRSQTLPRLSDIQTDSLSASPSNTSSFEQSFECAEDFHAFQRILGGIGQVHCW